MRQAGVFEAPPRERRVRGWVDFGVDDTWEPAPRRRRILDAEREFGEEPRRARPARAITAERPAADTDGDLAPVAAGGIAPLAAVGERPRVARRLDAVGEGAHVATIEDHAAGGARGGSAPAAAVRYPGYDRAAAPRRASDFDVDPRPRGSAIGGVPGRRTVTIRGRGAERDLAFPGPGAARRPAVRRHERPGFKPDRAGLWAVLLCLLLVLVAAASAHGAVLKNARSAPAAARVAHLAPARPSTRAFR